MNKNKGFTLIELLVVILIIGILAAIAIPNYLKSVTKARVSEALVVTKNIADAQKRYRILNDNFTNQFKFLDLTFIQERGDNVGARAEGNVYLTKNYTYTLAANAVIACPARGSSSGIRYDFTVERDGATCEDSERSVGICASLGLPEGNGICGAPEENNGD